MERAEKASEREARWKVSLDAAGSKNAAIEKRFNNFLKKRERGRSKGNLWGMLTKGESATGTSETARRRSNFKNTPPDRDEQGKRGRSAQGENL